MAVNELDPRFVYRAIDDLGRLVDEKFKSVNVRLSAIEQRLGRNAEDELLGRRGRRLLDALAAAAIGAILAGAGVWLIDALRHHP